MIWNEQNGSANVKFQYARNVEVSLILYEYTCIFEEENLIFTFQ